MTCCLLSISILTFVIFNPHFDSQWLDPGSCAATWDAEISDPGPLVGAMFPIIGQNPDMMCFRPMRPFHTNIDYQAVNTPNITIATVEETDVVTGAVSVLEGQFNVFLTSTTPGATILYRIGVFLDQTLTTHLAPGKGNFGGADNSTFSCVPPTQCGFASCNVTFGIDKLCDPTSLCYISTTTTPASLFLIFKQTHYPNMTSIVQKHKHPVMLVIRTIKFLKTK